jgi:gliding motility-associated-like protein
MKKLIFIFILFSLQLSAQKEATFWYFGENAGLDFSTNPPTTINNGKINTFEGSSSISDKEGNLLFYSDGLSVFDKNGDIMSFSDGTKASGNLLGDPSSTQSGLIVPNPDSDLLYYLFTIDDAIDKENGLNFYTIDLSKRDGLGEIISGPESLSFGEENEWSEKVTAVAGKECRTIWLISATSTKFYAFKIDENGVNKNNPEITILPFKDNQRGYLKVSPDGKKLVEANQRDFSYIYDFNDETGAITNGRVLELEGAGYGVEFSPSSNKLYISTGEVSQQNRVRENVFIFQYDVSSSDIVKINSSRKSIYRGRGYRGALQLGIDQKIYYAKSKENSLGVINFPENIGDQVNYVHDGISLGNNKSTEGLPPFIQSFFSSVNFIDSSTNTVLSGANQELCNDDVLEIRPELDFSTLTVEHISWTKENDPSINYSTEKITIDKNLGSGIYTFEAIAINECGVRKVFLNSIEIIFKDKPIINTIPVYKECDFDNDPSDFVTTFILSSKENELYTGTDEVTIDFFETSDISFSKPLDKNNYRNSVPTTNGNHNIVVKITNKNAGCYQTKNLALKVNFSNLATYKDIYLCESLNNSSPLKSIGSGKSTFDFTKKTDEIIASSNGLLNHTDFNFNYFLTREEAILQINAIEAPYIKQYENNTTIFLKISAKSTNNCESFGQFNIYINEIPIPKGNEDPIFLCISNGIANSQTNTVPLNADTGNPLDTYKWFLNDEEILGETSAILNAKSAGNYRVEAIRNNPANSINLKDNSFCTGFNTFTVIESNEAVIESITFLDNQDNFEENSITVTVSGIGNYEYALNDNSISNFQKGEENLTYTFTSVPAGLNIVYVRDVNECGRENFTASTPIPFLYFQRHFTPNGDGKFDVWKVQGIDNDFYTSISYQIYDRYGKLLKNINQKIEDGWNGNFNGSPLPEDDYWYNIVLVDINGKVIKKTGHFSLIRE